MKRNKKCGIYSGNTIRRNGAGGATTRKFTFHKNGSCIKFGKIKLCKMCGKRMNCTMIGYETNNWVYRKPIRPKKYKESI